MGKTVRWWIAVLAVLALGAAACGEDTPPPAVTGETTTTTEAQVEEAASEEDAPTEEAFVDQATELCEESSAEIETALAPLAGEAEPSPENLEEVLGQVVDLARDLHADLAELTPPAGDEETIQSFLDAHAAATDAVEDAAAEPETAARIVSGQAKPYAAAHKIMDDYGVPACGSGESAATDTGAAGTGDVTQSPSGPTGSDTEGGTGTGGDSGGGSGETGSSGGGDTGDTEGTAGTESGTGASGGG